MSKEKILRFVSKYKIPLAIACGLSIIAYLNPVEYKGEYVAKAEAIEKLNSEMVDIGKTDKIDEITAETGKTEEKNNELKNVLEEKKVEFEKVKEEKEIKEAKEKEAKEREEEAKKKAEEEAKKKQEEAKKKAEEEAKRKANAQNNNNNTTASGNNGNSGGGTTQQAKPPAQKPAVQKPVNQGSVVYANGGSSKSNKYHSSPTAHNMEGAIKMSESDAKAKGYVACKNCYR